jgi:glutathione S-transferase
MQEAEKETQLLLKGLASLDAHLQSRIYLAGHALSLADVILCCDLRPAFEKVCPLARSMHAHARQMQRRHDLSH